MSVDCFCRHFVSRAGFKCMSYFKFHIQIKKNKNLKINSTITILHRIKLTYFCPRGQSLLICPCRPGLDRLFFRMKLTGVIVFAFAFLFGSSCAVKNSKIGEDNVDIAEVVAALINSDFRFQNDFSEEGLKDYEFSLNEKIAIESMILELAEDSQANRERISSALILASDLDKSEKDHLGSDEFKALSEKIMGAHDWFVKNTRNFKDLAKVLVEQEEFSLFKEFLIWNEGKYVSLELVKSVFSQDTTSVNDYMKEIQNTKITALTSFINEIYALSESPEDKIRRLKIRAVKLLIMTDKVAESLLKKKEKMLNNFNDEHVRSVFKDHGMMEHFYFPSQSEITDPSSPQIIADPPAPPPQSGITGPSAPPSQSVITGTASKMGHLEQFKLWYILLACFVVIIVAYFVYNRIKAGRSNGESTDL